MSKSNFEESKQVNQLLNILDSIDAYFYSLDAKWNFLYVSKCVANDFGFEPADLLGKNFWKMFPRFIGTAVEMNFREATEKRRIRTFEWKTIYVKNEYREFTVFPSAEGITVYGVDITKRKTAEQALEQTKERLQNVLNGIDDGVTLVSLDGKVLDSNRASLKLLGLTCEEFVGTNVYDIIVDEDRQRAINGAFEVLQKGKVINEVRVKRKNKPCFWAEISVTALRDSNNNPVLFLGVTRDVTERKKVEEALREAEEQFRALVESTSDIIWQVDEKAVYTYVSPKVKDVLGYEPDEVVGKTPFDLIDEEDEEKILAAFLEIANKKEPFYGLENWNIHKNGSRVLLETSGVPILDEKGQLLGYRGIDRDITERKRAEEAIKAGEENYRKLFNNMVDGFAYCKIACDKNGIPIDFVFLEVNSAFEKLTGLRKEMVIGKKVSEAIPGTLEANPELIDTYGRVALTGKEERFEVFFKPLGIWLLITVYSPQKGFFTALFDNITERKKTEKLIEDYTKNLEQVVEARTKQLQEQERLAAIGQTAGMVGHDIRNPLQAMSSDLYLIKEESKDLPNSDNKTAVLDSVKSIEENITYIDKIVSDLQDYTRPIAPSIKDVDVKALINHILSTARIPHLIQTHVMVENGLTLKTDADYLRRILMNLVINAVQAMPKEGSLTIQVSMGDRVKIVVEDTGMGIPDFVKEKMFTPLFTTKAKGQGLGLAVVKRLVEGLNGSIRVESEERKGTKFVIELPNIR